MHSLTTLPVSAPCPTCERVSEHPILLAMAARPRRLEEDPRIVPDGDHVGLLRECERCWQARAFAIRAARASLVARGMVGEAPSGLPTWRGAELRNEWDGRSTPDELHVAMASELMRRRVRHGSLRSGVKVLIRVEAGQARLLVPSKSARTTA